MGRALRRKVSPVFARHFAIDNIFYQYIFNRISLSSRPLFDCGICICLIKHQERHRMLDYKDGGAQTIQGINLKSNVVLSLQNTLPLSPRRMNLINWPELISISQPWRFSRPTITANIKRTFWLIALCPFAIGIIGPSALAADISVVDTPIGEPQLRISGTIVQGDSAKVRRLLLATNFIPSVLIESPGGDVVEAIKIGRYMRATSLEVASIEICNSACYLIVAGGVKTWVWNVGLHRPRFEPRYFSGLSRAQAELKYKELSRVVREYLLEMDVHPDVIEAIFSVASDGMLHVSRDTKSPEDLWRKVDGIRPAYSEWLLAKCGRSPAFFNSGPAIRFAELNDYLVCETQARRAAYADGIAALKKIPQQSR